MTGPIYQFPHAQTPDHVGADRIFTSAMTGLYGWTTLGMVLAGTTAWILHTTETYLAASPGRFILTFLLALGLLMASHFTARREIPIAVPVTLYLAFTAVEGATLAFIFAVFSPSSITTAFGGALLIFTAMSLYGMRTGRNLAGLGQLSLIGLFGLVAAMIFNLLVLQSDGLGIFMSALTIPIFMGLTAWETKEIKRESQRAANEGDAGAASRLAVVGAAGMFLNILNMFLALLNLLSLDFSGFGGD